jgi:hypothetical protein
MAFENIAFTHAVQPLTNSGKSLCLLNHLLQVHDCTGNTFFSGKQLKLLACGECELGPLGWSEGGSEYWLACSRVGYGG